MEGYFIGGFFIGLIVGGALMFTHYSRVIAKLTMAKENIKDRVSKL